MTAPPAPTSGLATRLASFVDALRERGVVIGPSELIDGARAITVLDVLDRESFREGLACTLVRSNSDRDVFDPLFNLYFPPRPTSDQPTEQDEAIRTQAPDGSLRATDEFREQAAQIMAADGAESSGRLDELIEQIVAEFGSYGSGQGTAYSAYQAISAMHAQTLIARIAAAFAVNDGRDADAGADPMYRAAARTAVEDMKTRIERETAHRMAQLRGEERVAKYAVPQRAEDVGFLGADRKELARMRLTVAPLARLLATRMVVRRRRARRGPVDLRRTLRGSMSTGGVPVKLVHRKPRPGRPELVILCDLSGSVANFSRFTLMLVEALDQQFSKVRVFGFIDSVAEITDFFGPQHPGGLDLAEMISSVPMITRGGHSDYGRVLRQFATEHTEALTPRSTLLILGDARTNYADPNVAALDDILDRAKSAYWLNPEPRSIWGTGDSVAPRYAREIDMHECRTADQLARIIADLLPV